MLSRCASLRSPATSWLGCHVRCASSLAEQHAKIAAASATAAAPADPDVADHELHRRLGLGSRLSPTAGNAVKVALRVGYRHIDCAHIYVNEKQIGETAFKGMRSSDRGKTFVTSKLWCTEFSPMDVRQNCEQTLRDLQLDYLDLYLIHWPVPLKKDCPGRGSLAAATKLGVTKLSADHFSTIPLTETWAALEGLVSSGLVRKIGLCNSGPGHVEQILGSCSIKPAMVQNEGHPYLPQDDFLDMCAAHGIGVTAYSPLGNPNRPVQSPDDPVLMEESIVNQIAAERGMTVAQVLIRWGLQRGTVMIPKSETPARILSNFEAADPRFKLSMEEMEAISRLKKDSAEDAMAGRTLTGAFWLKPGQTMENFWGLDGRVPGTVL